MTVYNINLGIGWASSGVEYAQAYRAQCLRQLEIESKFIFTDFIGQDNIIDLTRNIGFRDEEVIWLYLAFTDQKLAPTSFTLDDLLTQYDGEVHRTERQGKRVRFFDDVKNQFVTAYLKDENQDIVHRVEYVSRGCVIRKDFYSYTKMFTEFYYPKQNKAHLYQRSYYNEDGSVAYDEIMSDTGSFFRFPDRLLMSKEELVAHFLDKLALTKQDTIILDRATGIGQAVFRHVKPARLGVVIHAEHYVKGTEEEGHLLWNNYYEYQLSYAQHVDFFVLATDKQKQVLSQQLRELGKPLPRLVTIPVGSLANLSYPKGQRKAYHAMTASRLATEKHVDWLVKAVIEAKKSLPDLIFDIYGQGGEEALLKQIITSHQAEGYIRLKGHQELTEIYQNYQLYLTASTSEGFGLTLLEAVGAGLPMIGFDVPYGNQTFIAPNKNGYLIPQMDDQDEATIVASFAQAIKQLFQKDKLSDLEQASYHIASEFLSEKVVKKWERLFKELADD
ncbi:accessory Sec system glycosyltransferase GtfA [Streptococcus cuniculipharyngis]|uniref:UDP-N-acetylglucosamine--peptide N-acetylglucosaminyltransferase GtfA subunit n=1 Tax=Streptococcus cuniculipharyngis TaxID=1562651 RepID=A0A5C5SG60_9STRE|nr:accessory Sec system glycosyltransferase GtfA [Streptococcus cuniculipharyngis]TWS98891.1 accessory Sec system glycosyltransferase GtfA [Streptococcus cuniculipharyngis]